jgi:lambda repressor-like predicted transcriptional regulator
LIRRIHAAGQPRVPLEETQEWANLIDALGGPPNRSTTAAEAEETNYSGQNLDEALGPYIRDPDQPPERAFDRLARLRQEAEERQRQIWGDDLMEIYGGAPEEPGGDVGQTYADAPPWWDREVDGPPEEGASPWTALGEAIGWGTQTASDAIPIQGIDETPEQRADRIEAAQRLAELGRIRERREQPPAVSPGQRAGVLPPPLGGYNRPRGTTPPLPPALEEEPPSSPPTTLAPPPGEEGPTRNQSIGGGMRWLLGLLKGWGRGSEGGVLGPATPLGPPSEESAVDRFKREMAAYTEKMNAPAPTALSPLPTIPPQPGEGVTDADWEHLSPEGRDEYTREWYTLLQQLAAEQGQPNPVWTQRDQNGMEQWLDLHRAGLTPEPPPKGYTEPYVPPGYKPVVPGEGPYDEEDELWREAVQEGYAGPAAPPRTVIDPATGGPLTTSPPPAEKPNMFPIPSFPMAPPLEEGPPGSPPTTLAPPPEEGPTRNAAVYRESRPGRPLGQGWSKGNIFPATPSGPRFDPTPAIEAAGGVRALQRLMGWAGTSPVTDPKGITLANADRIAVALGLHPIDLWPNFHDDIIQADAEGREPPRYQNQRGRPKGTPGAGTGGPKNVPRYPLDAALKASGKSTWALEKLIGLSHGQGSPLRDKRGVTAHQAAKVARAIGVEPTELWPDFTPNKPAATGSTTAAEGPTRNLSATGLDMPSEGERPAFPAEWDVNNPDDRRRHFEQVYESLLENLVGTFTDPTAAGPPKPEDLPRVGPGSAWSQGRNVVRPSDAGLPPWWSDYGTTEERRDWLIENPEYQIAPDFTDPTDYPVDIPEPDERFRATWFGGDEVDRYWAGPQAGVGKADQANVFGNQQARKPWPQSTTAAEGPTQNAMAMGDGEVRDLGEYRARRELGLGGVPREDRGGWSDLIDNLAGQSRRARGLDEPIGPSETLEVVRKVQWYAKVARIAHQMGIDFEEALALLDENGVGPSGEGPDQSASSYEPGDAGTRFGGGWGAAAERQAEAGSRRTGDWTFGPGTVRDAMGQAPNVEAPASGPTEEEIWELLRRQINPPIYAPGVRDVSSPWNQLLAAGVR